MYMEGLGLMVYVGLYKCLCVCVCVYVYVCGALSVRWPQTVCDCPCSSDNLHHFPWGLAFGISLSVTIISNYTIQYQLLSIAGTSRMFYILWDILCIIPLHLSWARYISTNYSAAG